MNNVIFVSLPSKLLNVKVQIVRIGSVAIMGMVNTAQHASINEERTKVQKK